MQEVWDSVKEWYAVRGLKMPKEEQEMCKRELEEEAKEHPIGRESPLSTHLSQFSLLLSLLSSSCPSVLMGLFGPNTPLPPAGNGG